MSDKKKKNYHIHYNTSNESFIKIYQKLKEAGIKNNKFFLALYDEKLMEIDPLDEENLSKEDKTRILIEITKNPWYYIREIIRIPVAGGNTHFELDVGNLSQIYLMLNNFNLIKEQPRQTGKTICAVVVYSWIYKFGTTNSELDFGNKDFGDSKLNVKRMKDLIDTMPSYIRTKNNRDSNRIEYIENFLNKNKIKALPTALSSVQADKLGQTYFKYLQII